MAQYPIKMLKDENGTPFVPLVAPEAVKDNQGTDWQTLIDRKLEKTNIIAGQNVTITTEGNDITINSAAGGASANVIDNLDQTTGGVGVLDAHQGHVLKGMIPDVVNNLTTVDTTKALSAYQGYLLNNRVVPGGGTTGQVLKKKSATDNDLEWGDAASAVGDALPIGTLSPFVGLVAPKGYLICMGQLVDKAKYPELWELCGDTFGPSTATQFYLPDLRGQVIAGYKEGDSVFGTLGGLIGALTKSYTPAGKNTGTAVTLNAVELTHSGGAVQSHTLKINEIPSHTHGYVRPGSDLTNTDQTPGPAVVSTRDPGEASTGSTGGGQGHSHGFTQPSKHSFTPTTKSITQPTFTGTQADINVVQPTAVMNWIIKASMLAVVTGNIEDSLTSTSSTDALSARQGKVLKDLVDTKVNISDIVNNLTSTTTNKPLSAAQGKVLNDKFSTMGTYSTTETNTGMTWIDGKTIYRKVIAYTGNPSSQAISTGITGMTWLVNAWGVAKMEGDQIYLPMNFYNEGGWNTFHVTDNGGVIQYQREASNYKTIKMYFVLEYTK